MSKNLAFNKYVYPENKQNSAMIELLVSEIRSGDYDSITKFILNNNSVLNIKNNKTSYTLIHHIMEPLSPLDKKDKLKMCYFLLNNGKIKD